MLLNIAKCVGVKGVIAEYYFLLESSDEWNLQIRKDFCF